jgi:hypothetical protein
LPHTGNYISFDEKVPNISSKFSDIGDAAFERNINLRLLVTIHVSSFFWRIPTQLIIISPHSKQKKISPSLTEKMLSTGVWIEALSMWKSISGI